MGKLWESPWSVAVIALMIAVIVLARGGFGTPQGARAGLAIVGLLLIGFLWPPLGMLIGGVALFYLVLVHGPALLQQLTQPVSPPGGTP
jgi:hypothetical protein